MVLSLRLWPDRSSQLTRATPCPSMCRPRDAASQRSTRSQALRSNGGEMSRRTTSDGAPRDATARALFDLIMEVAPTYRRISAAGLKLGTRTAHGGHWWLVRRLRAVGEQTVPQLAQFRGVSRQHVQVTVNDLVQRGLVEVLDNPRHKRSKLVRLTTRGRNYVEATGDRLSLWIDTMVHDFTKKEALTATRALRKLCAVPLQDEE